MDREFLERAAEIELRLEAEHMFLTAEAIRQVVNAYVADHTNLKMNTIGPKTAETKTGLTMR